MAKRWTAEKRAEITARLRPCETCGRPFLPWRKSDPGRFCSRRCILAKVRTPEVVALAVQRSLASRAAKRAAKLAVQP